MHKSLLNRRKMASFSVENSAEEAHIYLYDSIGKGWFGGIGSKDIIDTLAQIEQKSVHMHINSPGGDVFEGLAIANAMRDSDHRITVHIDALAASIASVIAIAGDYVRMADNAFMMIHDPFTFAAGNAGDFRKTADLLDKVKGTLANEYVKRSSMPMDEVSQLMADETWFTATEAKAKGLIDAIDHENKDAVTDAFDLTVYGKTPSALLEREAQEPNVRDTEWALREAGFSRTEAKRMASVALAALKKTPREAETNQSEDLLARLQEVTNNLISLTQ